MAPKVDLYSGEEETVGQGAGASVVRVGLHASHGCGCFGGVGSTLLAGGWMTEEEREGGEDGRCCVASCM